MQLNEILQIDYKLDVAEWNGVGPPPNPLCVIGLNPYDPRWKGRGYGLHWRIRREPGRIQIGPVGAKIPIPEPVKKQPQKSPSESIGIKDLIKLFDSKCAYCGLSVIHGKVSYSEHIKNLATVDHIIPRSRGGTGEKHNKVLACADCNSKKGNRGVGDFLESIGQSHRLREFTCR